VFSYVVLGAGFFTTQTAQATVHTGVAQASSSLEIVGNVMGIAVTEPATRLTYINTSVALTAGGTAMDLKQMVISYSDTAGGRNPNISFTEGDGVTTGTMNDCDGTGTGVFDDSDTIANQHWCVSQKINDLNVGSENDLLEPNEIWVLSINMPSTAKVNQKITVNLQPAVGAVLPITRTIPGAINPVQSIY
jgi:flagellin FlaB